MNKQELAKESVGAIKGVLARLPAGSFQILSEQWEKELEQGDDYSILWELKLAPLNPNACPVSVWVSSDEDHDLKYGLLFDSWEGVGKRLDLRVSMRKCPVGAFGTESTYMSLDTVLKILTSVFQGRVILRYIPIGRMLVDTAGEVAIGDGTERFGGGILLSYFDGEKFQYESWS